MAFDNLCFDLDVAYSIKFVLLINCGLLIALPCISRLYNPNYHGSSRRFETPNFVLCGSEKSICKLRVKQKWLWGEGEVKEL